MYINVYVLCTQYVYTLKIFIFTSDVIEHYIGSYCQSPNSRNTQF